MKSLLTVVVMMMAMVIPSRAVAESASPWSVVCLESSSDDWSKCERYTRNLSDSCLTVNRVLTRDGRLLVDVIVSTPDSITLISFCDEQSVAEEDTLAVDILTGLWQDGVFSGLPLRAREPIWRKVFPPLEKETE
jgi:hypothetical protein